MALFMEKWPETVHKTLPGNTGGVWAMWSPQDPHPLDFLNVTVYQETPMNYYSHGKFLSPVLSGILGIVSCDFITGNQWKREKIPV